MRRNTIWGAICLAMLATACQKQEYERVYAAKPEKTIGANAGKIVKLSKDTVYILNDNLVRNDGEQIIIEEGTLIKVRIGSGAGITVNRGGLLISNGTAESPVVFTSVTPTGNQGTNWAGITFNGKAVNNNNPTGADNTDLSGSITFTRIEFGSLRLNGVGSRSVIENVQVSYATTSSFEIVGGNFNTRNLVSYACGGPADFYVSNGYSGKMQYLLAYRQPIFGQFGSNPNNALAGIYIENHPFNSVNAKPKTNPIISNLTVIGPNAQNGSALVYGDTTRRSGALVVSNNAGFQIRNSIFMGYPGSALYLDDSLTTASIRYNFSELRSSIFHSPNRVRTFYLKPNTYAPFASTELENYMLQPSWHNRVFDNAAAFTFGDPFYYEAPDLLPNDTAVVNGADFTGSNYSTWFTTGTFVGAFGANNWLRSWTNFVPLKTNYNFPN